MKMIFYQMKMYLELLMMLSTTSKMLLSQRSKRFLCKDSIFKLLPRLEEALDGSKSATTGRIKDSLKMLDDMRKDYFVVQ